MRLPKESPREKKILKCGIMKIWQILQYDSSISQFSVLSLGRRIQAKKIVVAFERTSPEFQLRARSWGRAVVQTKIQLFSRFLHSSSHQHQHQPTSTNTSTTSPITMMVTLGVKRWTTPSPIPWKR